MKKVELLSQELEKMKNSDDASAKSINNMQTALNKAETEVIKWRHVANVATEKMKELEQEIARLERENKEIKDDYEQFVNIMNRARRLVTLDTEEERVAPVFKMERNGNLVASSTPPQENGEQLQ